MVQHLRPQFRPSLFIFLGTVGEQIREYLSPYYYGKYQRRLLDPPTPSTYHLLAYLDEPLRGSVALLQVITEGKDADPHAAIAFPVMEEFPPHDKDMPRGAGELGEMIYKALFSVQLARRIDAIRTEGYSVSNTRTQVFIIGEPNADNALWLAATLQEVRQSALRLNLELPICYALNNYDTVTDHSSTLEKRLSSPGPKWASYDLTNFSYVYEPKIPYPTPMTVAHDEVRYATAEMLLALAATGMTALPIFESEMQLPPALENYARHVGNLSTSMIRFPRPSVRRYCSANLTRDLVRKWRQDLDLSTIMPEEREQAKDDGRELISNLKSWIVSDDPDASDGPNQRPSLEVLWQAQLAGVKMPADKQQDAYDRLQDKNVDLFDLFSYEDMADAYRRRKDKTQTWAELAQERISKAVGYYEQWERAAKIAWNMVDSCVNDHITYHIDKRWASGPKGFAIARIFVDQFDDELVKFNVVVSELSRDHRTDYYRRQRPHFGQLADDDGQGKWCVSPNQQSVMSAAQPSQPSQPNQTTPPSGQARPTMGNTPLQSNPAGPGGGGGLQPLPQHLPQAEAQIARDLRARVVWKQNQRPSAAALCSVGLLGWIGLLFSASALPLSLPFFMAAIALLAVLVAAGNLGFSLMRRREFVMAQKDVLNFYQSYYDFKCMEREDLQRMSMVRTMRSRIGRIRQRLDNMSQFLEERAITATEDAAQAHRSLFDGPAATRDVFIADGERLQARGAHTLESVSSKVEQVRQNRPLQDWHRTLDAIRDRMVRELQQGNRSLMDMDETQLQDYLYHFTEPIIDGYLCGSLVDISAALDKPDIWREVREQVRRPLYTADTGVRDPHLMFVCGSAQALAKSNSYIPKDAFQLLAKGDEWLMVAGFFRGGTPRTIDADLLFPPKSSPASSSASSSSSAGTPAAAGAGAASAGPSPAAGTP